ncbi:MAG: MerR family transcriptional regulator [Gemmatimonadota bacterium]
MRMKELEERSGISRTAIHHYLREGLLPEPEKTAANAALYGEAHVERLALIRKLRSGHLGPHSLPTIKRILARIDAGATPVAAILLEQMVDGDVVEQGPLSAHDLARVTGVERSAIHDFINAGILIDTGPGKSFDAADVAMVRQCAGLFHTTPLECSDLTPVVELIGEIVRYEESLAGLVSTVDTAAGEQGRTALERALGVLHAYLFARAPGHEPETLA